MKEKLLIRIYITRWGRDCSRVINFLHKYEIELDVIDIDTDIDADKFVRALNRGYRSVPTLIFPDESFLVEPSLQVLSNKINELFALYKNQ